MPRKLSVMVWLLNIPQRPRVEGLVANLQHYWEKQWSQETMDQNLKNREPKEIFFPFKLIHCRYFVIALESRLTQCLLGIVNDGKTALHSNSKLKHLSIHPPSQPASHVPDFPLRCRTHKCTLEGALTPFLSLFLFLSCWFCFLGVRELCKICFMHIE